MERTLVLLKPDCLQRHLAGRMISRLEDKGLNIIAMKMFHMSPELARQHYAAHLFEPLNGKLLRGRNSQIQLKHLDRRYRSHRY